MYRVLNALSEYAYLLHIKRPYFTNSIISSFIRPRDTKLSKVVTLDEGTLPTKSRGTSISWSHGK